MRRLLIVALVGVAACGDASVADPSISTTTPVEVSTTNAPSISSSSTHALPPSTTEPVLTTTTTSNPVNSSTSSASSPDYDPALQSLVDTAIADLAQRLGVAAESIAVLSAEAVVWPDGALGCPKPGMAYTQAQVDGARIILEYAGTAYPYHSGGSSPLFLCENR